jgi:putative transposase
MCAGQACNGYGALQQLRSNGHRPHQALQQESPQRQPSQAVDITARIERRQVLDGLITEYRRAA